MYKFSTDWRILCQVQQQWFSYTEKVDRMVEEAFRLNIKWSLQELARAINGDGKSSPNPLFKVQVVLENDRVCVYYWFPILVYYIEAVLFVVNFGNYFVIILVICFN